jgi:hypothetical protein
MRNRFFLHCVCCFFLYTKLNAQNINLEFLKLEKINFKLSFRESLSLLEKDSTLTINYIDTSGTQKDIKITSSFSDSIFFSFYKKDLLSFCDFFSSDTLLFNNLIKYCDLHYRLKGDVAQNIKSEEDKTSQPNGKYCLKRKRVYCKNRVYITIVYNKGECNYLQYHVKVINSQNARTW